MTTLKKQKKKNNYEFKQRPQFFAVIQIDASIYCNMIMNLRTKKLLIKRSQVLQSSLITNKRNNLNFEFLANQIIN